jgi:hypothetical protein
MTWYLVKRRNNFTFVLVSVVSWPAHAFEVSAVPGHIAGNKFPNKLLALSSRYSEFPQVIYNEPLRFLNLLSTFRQTLHLPHSPHNVMLQRQFLWHGRCACCLNTDFLFCSSLFELALLSIFLSCFDVSLEEVTKSNVPLVQRVLFELIQVAWSLLVILFYLRVYTESQPRRTTLSS